MELFLDQPITVPFDNLFLDPNNPRLALEETPGYGMPERLFDPELQQDLEVRVQKVYQVGDLEQAIIGQGWMPIDNIVVWTYPGNNDRHVVLEGNTRTVALRNIRRRLQKEREKLARLKDGRKRFAANTIAEQEDLVVSLERVVRDTAQLTVVPLRAKDVEELQRKIPRVLAVRHITGAKTWGAYAEDLWLLERYQNLFDDKWHGAKLRWDTDLLKHVADEASLSTMVAKRKLRSASMYSHFRAAFEDELPKDEEFTPHDYYLFELLVKGIWLRQQFSITEDDLHIPADRERVLFDWTFKKPRGRTADENQNVFYRHENIRDWEKIKRYDDKHGTFFASRLNVEDPDNVPRFAEIEADYLAHKARKQPVQVIGQLLEQLNRLTIETLRTEGTALEYQLEELQARTEELLRMLQAAESAPGRLA